MTIGIYRNRLNKEMKKFGKFAKDIVVNLSDSDIEIDIIFEDRKQMCLDRIKESDTIFIISHGDDDVIYHKYDFKDGRHQNLIDDSNLIDIKDKKIIAISCRTARGLGDRACKIGGCKVYLGFYNQIHFDKRNGKPPSREYVTFIKKCYKDIFSNVIEKAILEQWSFNKFKIILGNELKKNVIIRANIFKGKNDKKYIRNGIKQAIFAVSDVADNIDIFGNPKEKIS